MPIADTQTTVVCVPYLSMHPKKDPSMVELAQFIGRVGGAAGGVGGETVMYSYELHRRRKHPSASLVSVHSQSLIPVVHISRPPPLDDFKQVQQAGSSAVMTFRTLNPKIVSESEKQAEQQLLASCKCPVELRGRCYIARWKHCSTERSYCQYKVMGEPIPRGWGVCRFIIML